MSTTLFKWSFDFSKSPSELWPYLAHTDKFNQWANIPTLQREGWEDHSFRQKLAIKKYGITAHYLEEPFDWVRDQRFSVRRHFLDGPLRNFQMQAELRPSGTGSHLDYQITVEPRNLLGAVAALVEIGWIQKKVFLRTFASIEKTLTQRTATVRPTFPLPPTQRAEVFARLLQNELQAPEAEFLLREVEEAEELDLRHMRPYGWVNRWPEKSPAELMHMALKANLAGLLDFQWALSCPHCRGVKVEVKTLHDVPDEIFCEACEHRASTVLEENVEITFHPRPVYRSVGREEYCVGGPGKTEHIVAQKYLAPGETFHQRLALDAGSYRIRKFRSQEAENWTLSQATDFNWSLRNSSAQPELYMLERQAWSEDRATAKDLAEDVFFRRFFSGEILKRGKKIQVGTLTFAFTDLKGSTALYQRRGDAEAFSFVLTHFEILEREILKHHGKIIKTIGDAIMASFERSQDAVRAFSDAQKHIAEAGQGELSLRAGLHRGPALLTTLNEQLDYFGSTINFAARLEGLSSGQDIICSETVLADLRSQNALENFRVESFSAQVKGFADQEFNFYRLQSMP